MNKDPRYAKYKIGRWTYGDPKIEDHWGHNGVTLTIGSFCSIAKGVTIWLGGNHHNEWISTSPLNHFLHYDDNKHTCHRFDQTGTKGSVVIGNDVWIGAEVTIFSGVIIGDGSIIGAKSVVAKNIPPYCVAVGNPVKIVKKRFSDCVIEKLLSIRWWDWDDEKIRQNIPLILGGDINQFVKEHEPK